MAVLPTAANAGLSTISGELAVTATADQVEVGTPVEGTPVTQAQEEGKPAESNVATAATPKAKVKKATEPKTAKAKTKKETKKMPALKTKTEGGKGKTKKTKKAAAERKPREKADITGNQASILKALDKTKNANGQMTREQIGKATEINKGFSKLIGASDGEPAADTLMGKGYVKTDVVEGDRHVYHAITAAGRKALEKYNSNGNGKA